MYARITKSLKNKLEQEYFFEYRYILGSIKRIFHKAKSFLKSPRRLRIAGEFSHTFQRPVPGRLHRRLQLKDHSSEAY